MEKRDRLRLALETGFTLQTIVKWERGGKVAYPTEIALMRAASELGLIREDEAPRDEVANG